MTRAFNCAIIMMVLSVFSVPWVNAADMSADYLEGRWVLDDKDCSSPHSEYMEFNKNGTFQGTRTGQTEIIGFWVLKDDIMKLHMVTSPAFFDDIHQDLASFDGSYSYFKANMVTFNIQKKSFEAFAIIGNEIKKTSAVKCP